MRVKHAVVPTAKSLTATAVVKLLAPIRRNRIAKTVFPTAAAVSKTATAAMLARHVKQVMSWHQTRVRPRIVRRAIRPACRVKTARKKKVRPVIRELPFARSASTAMRVNNAVALRDKCPTATAVANRDVPIRPTRRASKDRKIARLAPKTATAAIPVRHAPPGLT